MCGIIGVLTKKPSISTRKMFKSMHFFDRLRGEHSSGIFGVDSTGGQAWYKRAVPTPDFYLFKPATDVLNDLDNQLLVGHNRHATVGKINDVSAHPFSCGDLLGVHNGTLKTRYNLEDYTKIDVDSENIFHHMDKHGIEDTIQKLDGAFALVWHNIKTNTVHLIRNSERPLFIAQNKAKDAVFFASEAWMIEVSAHLAKIELGEIKEVEEGHLYSFDIDKFPKEECFTKRKLKMREPGFQPTYGNVGGRYTGAYHNNTGAGAVSTNTNRRKVKQHRAIGDQVTFKPERTGKTYQRNVNEYEYALYGKTLDNVPVKMVVSEDMYDEINRRGIAQMLNVRSPFVGYRYMQALNGKHSEHEYLLDGIMMPAAVTINFRTQPSTDLPHGAEKKLPVVADKRAGVSILSIKGYNDRPLTINKFREITKCGCAVCADPVTVEGSNEITWLTDDAFLCKPCSENRDSGMLSGIL